MRVRLTKRFDFDCAHQLTTFPAGHKCQRVHGHRMYVDLVLEGDVPEARGYLVDFGEVKKIITPLREELDHQMLNDVAGLEIPTVENLCRWVWDRVKPELGELVLVRIQETPDNVCEYWGE